MYNNEKKMEFINEYARNDKEIELCMDTFEISERIEDELHKDVSSMSDEEIADVLKVFSKKWANQYHQRILILQEYVRYRLITLGDNEISGSIFKTNSKEISSVKKSMVSGPEHLNSFLNIVCRPEEENTIDDVYRVICWLAFGGMRETDAYCVKSEDVDMQNMIISNNDSGIDIYKESIRALNNCIKSSYFVYTNNNYKEKITRKRIDGDILLRGVRSYAPSSRTFRNVLNQKCIYFKEKMGGDFQTNYNKIYMSGIFYRVFQIESDGWYPSFRLIAEDFTKDKKYWFSVKDVKYNMEYKISSKEKEYLERYAEWKMAFKLYRIK